MARVSSILSVLIFGFLLYAASAPAQAQDSLAPLDDTYEAIEDFIREQYLSSWFASPRLIRRNFSDPLDYYWGKKNVPLKRVIKDKIAYVTRWPQRYYRLMGDSLQVARTEIGDDIFAVKFKYEFETRRKGDQRAGIGQTSLLIELVEGRVRIRGEGGKVLERF